METKDIRDILPDDILGEDLFHNDLLIIKKGTRLSKHIIAQLRKRNINQIKIKLEVPEVVPTAVDESVQNRMEAPIHQDTFVKDTFFEALADIGFEYRYGQIMNKEEDVLLLIRLFEKLQQNYQSMDLLYALKSYDPYSYAHSFDSFVLGVLMAKRLGLVDLESIALGYLLHDIGKLNLSEELLKKPGKLTNAEFDDIKQHTTEGEMLLNKLGLHHIAHFARSHHERMDGSGYPDNLTKLDMSEELSLLQIVDVYSALTLKRSYKEEISGQEALGLMFNDSQLFDTALLKALSETLNIYPTEATVLLSDNTSATIKKRQRFLTLPSVKRTDKNQVITLPINYDVTVEKLIDVQSTTFQSCFKKFIRLLCKGEEEAVSSEFIQLIDRFKLEDIYTKVLLPAYWELTRMLVENTITKQENQTGVYELRRLLKNLKQDMIRINQFKTKILLVIDAGMQNNIITDFFVNLLLVENMLPVLIDNSKTASDIKHMATENDINHICYVLLSNYNQPVANSEVLKHFNLTRKTYEDIREILLSLSMTKPKVIHIYERVF